VARLLFILVPVAIAFWVYSIVDCAMQPPTRHRGVSKPAWLVIAILLPVLGGILWFVIGRGRGSSVAAVRAPDDDPAFLRGLGSSSEQDERIRRLEEELAQLDAEDDDPRWNRHGPHAGPHSHEQQGDTDGDDLRGQRGALG
jgi:hypothetical protein